MLGAGYHRREKGEEAEGSSYSSGHAKIGVNVELDQEMYWGEGFEHGPVGLKVREVWGRVGRG